MNDVLSAIPTGIFAFSVTNLDDLAILLLLFSQVNTGSSPLRAGHVILGQYLGFGALVLASSFGLVGGLALPHHWLGLLGLVPIGLGLSQLFNLNAPSAQEEDQSLPMLADQDSHSWGGAPTWLPLGWLDAKTWSVAAITMGNGGDNIGVYTLLFAHSSVQQWLVILGVFFILVGGWCWLARSLTSQPPIADWLTQQGPLVMPWGLILLGVYIILDSNAMTPAILGASCLCLVGLTWQSQRLGKVLESSE